MLSVQSDLTKRIQKAHLQPPKTFVIGACGFIGHAFLEAYKRFDPSAWGTHYRDSFSFKKFDLMQPDLEILEIPSYQYSYAIIAAAMNPILACEKEPQLSRQINVDGTLHLIEQLCIKDITPVFFSSDFVFDGKQNIYDENSPLNPLNEYGKQKADLERALVKNFKGRYLLIRTSKVYGLTKGDGTLIDEMAQLLVKGKVVRAAYDQVFCPIAIHDLVSTVIELQKIGAKDIFHVCGNKAFSRLEIAHAVCRALHSDINLVQPISLDDLGEPFFRPKQVHLINRKVYEKIRIPITSLQDSIRTIANQYLQESVHAKD